jgi:hypothetical protein
LFALIFPVLVAPLFNPWAPVTAGHRVAVSRTVNEYRWPSATAQSWVSVRLAMMGWPERLPVNAGVAVTAQPPPEVPTGRQRP